MPEKRMTFTGRQVKSILFQHAFDPARGADTVGREFLKYKDWDMAFSGAGLPGDDEEITLTMRDPNASQEPAAAPEQAVRQAAGSRSRRVRADYQKEL